MLFTSFHETMSSREYEMRNTAELVKKMCYQNGYSVPMFYQRFLLDDTIQNRKSIIAYYYKSR